jgi:hypothetical protein
MTSDDQGNGLLLPAGEPRQVEARNVKLACPGGSVQLQCAAKPY